MEKTERERERFRVLIHSPNAHSRQGCVRLKSGGRNRIWILSVGAGSLVVALSAAASRHVSRTRGQTQRHGSLLVPLIGAVRVPSASLTHRVTTPTTPSTFFQRMREIGAPTDFNLMMTEKNQKHLRNRSQMCSSSSSFSCAFSGDLGVRQHTRNGKYENKHGWCNSSVATYWAKCGRGSPSKSGRVHAGQASRGGQPSMQQVPLQNFLA